MNTLPTNTTLQGGKYKIQSLLGQGGFGITYLAEQVMLGRKVAIKEFFMKEYCARDETTSHVTIGTEGGRDTVERFRSKFLKEARNIAKLNHPNIVRIIDVFEENGTAYYVMEYAAGGSLADKVKQSGYMPESVATRYILQVAEALDYIHQKGMNHLDVKPANIMLNEKDEPILIDFGLSKQYDATTGNQTSTTPVGISEGYAPMEQYKTGGVGAFSPETDIYALGATFFKLLTGITPPCASDINEDGVPVEELKAKGVSQTATDVICKAMEGRKKDRMKSARSFIDGLKESNLTVSPSPYIPVEPNIPPQVEPQSESYDVEATVVDSEATKLDEEGVTDTRSKNSSVQIFTVNGVSFKMIRVEGGTFQMGASEEQGSDAWGDEKPVHIVTLDDYMIGETEVTQELWEAVMRNKPSEFNGAKNPVELVSWDDCKEFISKLNALTSQNFRLPTEAEWEFAARGGKNSQGFKYSGGDTIGDVAWYNGNSGNKTHPVGTKQANELGLYDMSGNVLEWCEDWYGGYRGSAQTNPKGPSDGLDRMYRGGGWSSEAWDCRVSCRLSITPSSRGSDLGLRLAL